MAQDLKSTAAVSPDSTIDDNAFFVGADGSVLLYSTPGLKCRAQYSGASLIKIDTNSWIIMGDLAA